MHHDSIIVTMCMISVFVFTRIIVQDNEDPKEKVKQFSTRRNIVTWHDHSNVAGSGLFSENLA